MGCRTQNFLPKLTSIFSKKKKTLWDLELLHLRKTELLLIEPPFNMGQGLTAWLGAPERRDKRRGGENGGERVTITERNDGPDYHDETQVPRDFFLIEQLVHLVQS